MAPTISVQTGPRVLLWQTDPSVHGVRKMCQGSWMSTNLTRATGGRPHQRGLAKPQTQCRSAHSSFELQPDVVPSPPGGVFDPKSRCTFRGELVTKPEFKSRNRNLMARRPRPTVFPPCGKCGG